MGETTSKDGTVIMFDKAGKGPAVIVVGGVLGDRSQQAPLAALLAEHFTVFNYDRRGHGESGFTPPHALEREVEDIAALMAEAGGPVCVYGTSGCAILALEAAAHGLDFKKLALWEPPYIIPGSRPPIPEGYQAQLNEMLASGRRGDIVEFFMVQMVGMPAEFVAQMRSSPWWPSQEAIAHTLLYDTSWLGDYSLPAARIAKVATPTLVLDGGQIPWLTQGAQAVADVLPHAQRRTLAGQPHNVDPVVLAPALVEFFSS